MQKSYSSPALPDSDLPPPCLPVPSMALQSDFDGKEIHKGGAGKRGAKTGEEGAGAEKGERLIAEIE